MFANLGIPIIDADQLAREVVEPGTPGLQRIATEFGDHVLSDEGRLDRKALADRVFADENARRKLNSILHPLIAAAGARHIAALHGDPAPYLIYEAALLVETGSYKAFSALIVVSAQRSAQRDRLIGRDDMTPEEADARLDAQLSLEDKAAVADYVVDNDGDLGQTRAQVALIHEKLVARFSTSESNP